MFIGRRNELEKLETAYKQKSYQCCMIYGRRRVGKTRLITEFIKNKKNILLVGTRDTEEELLRIFSEAVLAQVPMEGGAFLSSFPTWESLFSYITVQAKKEYLILCIDEFPYLAAAVPSIASKIQKYCDHEWKESNLFLILSGSSMSFMEKQILSYESPLYGRRTMQIKLLALPYYESIQFFPSWSKNDKLYAYSICGGIPQYLERFALYESFESAIRNELLSPSGALFGEPLALMNEELREPALYTAIIRTIARGQNKLHEIASAVGKEASRLSPYIENLISLNLIGKKTPIGTNSPRKSIYVINDYLFRFYYLFVTNNMWLIENNRSELVYLQIKQHLNEYFGHVFEDICLEFLKVKNFEGELPSIYTEAGFWWGPNKVEKKEEEIDIVFASDTDILVCECKWQNETVGGNILSTLKRRGSIIQNGRNISYALFSKSGFTSEIMEDSQTMKFTIDDLLLISSPEDTSPKVL